MSDEKMLTTRKAANFLGISTSTVYRMVEQGLLIPSKTPGGHRRFDTSDLESFKNQSSSIVAPQNPAEEKIKRNDDSILTSEPEKTMSVDARNNLNDLSGGEWLPETKSFFFQKGLGAKHPHAQIERQHPAPFSFQDVAHLITFFTKRNQKVLDPFGGVGSTAKACHLNERYCTSIELSEKWHNLAIQRLETEVCPGASKKHEFINGNCINELKNIGDSTFNFMITSPPYWSILNKKADHKVKKARLEENLAKNYSDDDENDLANTPDYNDFLQILCNDVFLECGRILKPKAYMAIVVSDFRNKSEFISFHSDLIQNINNKKTRDNYTISLQGVKVLLQNHKTLLPYGYPFAYVENIHHQYVLIFRKKDK